MMASQRPAPARASHGLSAAKQHRIVEPAHRRSNFVLASYLQEGTLPKVDPVPSTPPPRPPVTETVPTTEPPATTPPPAGIPETPPPTPLPDTTVNPPRTDAPSETYAPPVPPVEGPLGPPRSTTGPAAPANPTSIDWCLPPENLTIPEGELLTMLGYSPAHCFIYSQRNCFELALSCYRIGRYADAVLIADHGLRHGHYSPLLLIRGAAQIASGDCGGAQDAARQVYAANDYVNSRTYDTALERISGPDIGRVRELVQLYEGR
jgi:hypothetical protein